MTTVSYVPKAGHDNDYMSGVNQQCLYMLVPVAHTVSSTERLGGYKFFGASINIRVEITYGTLYL